MRKCTEAHPRYLFGTLLLLGSVQNLVCLTAGYASDLNITSHFLAVPTGHLPQGIVSEDLNQDGTLDIVALGGLTNDVRVYYGFPAEPFAPPQIIPVPEGPFDALAGDFDNDGDLDLVVTSKEASLVSVLRNVGSSFEPCSLTLVGSFPQQLTSGDFNSDGNLDVALTCGGPQVVTILLGQGDCSFQSGGVITVGGNPWDVAAGYLDADGHLDLAVCQRDSNQVAIYSGSGTGTFLRTQTIAVGQSPRALLCMDLNGDGLQELVVCNSVSNSVSILSRTGNLWSRSDFSVGPSGSFPYALAALDLNADGLTDLAVANYFSDTVALLTQNISSTFTLQLPLPSTHRPRFLSSFNGWLFASGELSSNFAAYSPDVLSNVLPKPITISVTGRPERVRAGDFDDDGNLDLAVARASLGSVGVLYGDGNGGFSAVQDLVSASGTNEVQIADVNNDMKPDIVATNYYAQTVSIFLNLGNRAFAEAIHVSMASAPIALAIADIDRDGNQDIAVGDYAGNVSILLGEGDGTFQSPTIFPVGLVVRDVILADLNGDLYPDIAACSEATSSVSVFLSNGFGGHEQAGVYAVECSPQSLVAADFDSDGDIDLATSMQCNPEGAVQLMWGNGAGVFSIAQADLHTVGVRPVEMAAGRLNGDSTSDFVTSNDGDNTMSVRLQSSAGTGQRMGLGTGRGAMGLELADIDNNGTTDCIVACGLDNLVTIHLNTSDQTSSVLQDADSRPFLRLQVRQGANDVILSVESDRRLAIDVQLYDVSGRLISSLFRGYIHGIHEIPFSKARQPRNSGMYFVRLVSGSESLTQKVILLH